MKLQQPFLPEPVLIPYSMKLADERLTISPCAESFFSLWYILYSGCW
mgnify:CR=1 FL=1